MSNNYEVPGKSACIGCPYKNDNSWREIKKRPKEWADAVEIDDAIRNGRRQGNHSEIVFT